MFTVYVLLNRVAPRTYVGFTKDLSNRFLEHNSGKVEATKPFRPWVVIYTESVSDIAEAKHRERYWKSGAGRRNLRKLMEGSRPTFRKLGEARSSPKKA
jgi:putative endonuclease